MLDRNPKPTQHYGFLLSVELEEGKATSEDVLRKISDALYWVEGVGEIVADCMGKLTIYEKQKDVNVNPTE